MDIGVIKFNAMTFPRVHLSALRTFSCVFVPSLLSGFGCRVFVTSYIVYIIWFWLSLVCIDFFSVVVVGKG